MKKRLFYNSRRISAAVMGVVVLRAFFISSFLRSVLPFYLPLYDGGLVVARRVSFH